MISANVILGIVAAIGAGLCVLIPAMLFSDQKEHPWRMLLMVLLVPLVPFGVAGLFGVYGWTWEWALLVYLAGLGIAALTVGWQYRKAQS